LKQKHLRSKPLKFGRKVSALSSLFISRQTLALVMLFLTQMVLEKYVGLYAVLASVVVLGLFILILMPM
jgi:hypothetical protein